MSATRVLMLLPLMGVLSLGTVAMAQEAPGDSVAEEEGTEGTEDEEGAEGDAEVDEAAAREQAEEAEAAARSAYNRELRTVEEEVGRLKERVFRSKATLQLLKELVIEGATLGSRVVLWHINKMGPAYTMESVQYFLDGKNVFTRVDPGGSLDGLREIKLHEQTIPPGSHSLQVHAVLRGSGFGVFSYLKTYSFKVHSSYTFEVEDGKQTTVRIVANERPGRTFVDRPGISYEEVAEALREDE